MQSPLPAAITDFLPHGVARGFHDDCGRQALAKARSLLGGAGVTYTPHVKVGDIARTFAETSAELRCDRIVMSSRGLGAVAGLVLGSTATRVLREVTGAVTLITGAPTESAG